MNEGAEEYLDSLKPGTIPINNDEEDFFESLWKDSMEFLDGKIDRFEDPEYRERDPSEKFLLNYYKTTKRRDIDVVILSVDIVGSTKLSRTLNQEDYAKIISVFLRGIAQIIHNYNGYSLKFVGDEIIAYFHSEDKEGMHNNALFCSYAIKKFVLKVLNPLLVERKLPEVSFRIGLNSGKAMLTVVGHPVSMQHFDLIGEPINIAKKIQVKTEINAILLGESATSFAHSFWRTKTEPLPEQIVGHIKVHKLNILV